VGTLWNIMAILYEHNGNTMRALWE
jgi:hypothetical protein